MKYNATAFQEVVIWNPLYQIKILSFWLLCCIICQICGGWNPSSKTIKLFLFKYIIQRFFFN